MLAFDNMCKRHLQGTHDWLEQEIVLDVPDESTNIGFGVIFNGLGKMWADDVSFELVDQSVPVTQCRRMTPNIYDTPPKNLNFESDETGDT